MMPAGSLNAWKCEQCGELTVAVHVDAGVTPMFLACRRTPGCRGVAVSSGYPTSPPPPEVIDALAWEWYRPTGRRYRRLNQPMREHVTRGGLVLRPITTAGRMAYAAGPL